MPKHLFKKYLPTPEKIREHRYLQRLGPALHNPNLWHLNRRSVAGGVAVGAFFAFIIPIAQFIAAAVAAVFFRVNLPVAVTATLITNPLTYAPFYYLAYKIGAWITGGPETTTIPADAVPQTGGLIDGFSLGFDSLMSLGIPLLVGLLILAIAFSAGGYLLVSIAWRIATVNRWRRRQMRRKSA